MKLKSLAPKVQRADLSTAARLPQEEGSYGQGRGGRPWRRLRLYVLERDKYQCQPCKAIGRISLAIEVDHITPICEGGKDEMRNLQGICGDCHKVKSAEESKRAMQRMA
jgi:5-methylcytosine-specific restriction enzyme A